MNKKEEFIRRLIIKTNDETLKWVLLPRNSDFYFILNQRFILRAFKLILKERNIFVIEKKKNVYNIDIDDFYEKKIIEVYVRNRDEIEFILDESNVSINLLKELIKTVSDNANDPNELEKLFDE